MINIYLIIIIIIFHLALILKKVLKLKKLDINEKLTDSKLSSTDLFSIQKITEHNHLYKILIVEDDMANRKIMKSQLTAAKYQVVTSKNGSSALKQLVSDKTIDIVLLDLMLPDISGFDVCTEIRKSYTLFDKPVIMVTSKNKLKDLVEGFAVGANDFITKPYNIYELIARINSSITLKNIYKDNTSLKKVNNLKSDIVDMAAHDLKSPLTIISGYSKRILKITEIESKESEIAKKILNSSDKMLSIINKMLHDSKYENFIINFENIEINSVIKKSIKFYSDMAEDKKQRINFISDIDKSFVELDFYSFVTIIENLINNAIKYSPIESEIDIEVINESDSISILIKDSGNGFTKEEIDNLFIKFFPFTNKPTKGENSTGLGLYIINDMVTRNRGTISVNSIRGKGSQFILNFPTN